MQRQWGVNSLKRVHAISTMMELGVMADTCTVSIPLIEYMPFLRWWKNCDSKEEFCVNSLIRVSLFSTENRENILKQYNYCVNSLKQVSLLIRYLSFLPLPMKKVLSPVNCVSIPLSGYLSFLLEFGKFKKQRWIQCVNSLNRVSFISTQRLWPLCNYS